jgi:spermidine synthase
MKPFHTLARTDTPDGAQLTLQEHDGQFYLKLNGRQLMSTAATLSEQLLGELACARLRGADQPTVLIGGLGFGFTLKAVLEILGPNAQVHVAELLPEVVAWNRELLGSVNGRLLDDARVKVLTENVFHVIRRVPKGAYDAIMLDIDDGPVSFTKGKKSFAYDWRGCGQISRALKPGGRAAFWSAAEDRPFAQRLSSAGFTVEVRETKAHEHAKRNAHRIYLATPADRDAPPPPPPSRQPHQGFGARRRS